MKPVFLNQGFSFWDQTLLKDILPSVLSDRQIVIVPGAINEVDEVSMELEQYPSVLVIVTSDEENKFPTDKLFHPNMKVFVTYPSFEKHKNVDGYLPIGYTPRTRELVKKNSMDTKSTDWFFAGQVTHGDRQRVMDKLVGVPNGRSVGTSGFAKGLDYEEYMEHMCRSKVVPCPAGNVSPDSFRLYEALEAGCIPLVTNKPFWEMLFGEFPMPVLQSWDELPDAIQHFKDRPDINNKCHAWWQLKKRELKCLLQY